MKRVALWLLPAVLGAKVLDLEVLYDPFGSAQKIIRKNRLPVTPRPIVPILRLFAIFGDKAYINGRFYKIGERVGGFYIIKITNNYVLLQRKGKKKILFLRKKRILKTGER